MRHDIMHVIAALKEMHREILALRKDIDELRDDVKTMERGGGIQFVVREPEGSSEEESESESVQSAPATVSY